MGFYSKTGDIDDRVKVLEGQVLELTELTDGDFLQYDETEGALIGKSISEMKTLLGLPTRYAAFTASLVNAADTTYLQTISQKFYTDTFTITITKTDVGEYAINFNDEWGSATAWNNTRKLVQPIYDNLLNSLPTDYTMDVNVGTSNYILIAFKESGLAAEVPTNEQIILDIRVEY